jgi:hypothetical protein
MLFLDLMDIKPFLLGSNKLQDAYFQRHLDNIDQLLEEEKYYSMEYEKIIYYHQSIDIYTTIE